MFPAAFATGQAEPNIHSAAICDPYLGYVDANNLNGLRIVVNAGNGAAGHVIDAIEAKVASGSSRIEFIKVHHEADGSFPNGIPILCCRKTGSLPQRLCGVTAPTWVSPGHGDFDRCFLFDEQGEFIEGYYIVGLLAEAFLRKSPGEKIIHDPRLTWNNVDMVKQAGGIPILCKTGHAFIKERMRKENAVYGGEMSAHHYFRDFAYCDSGMIPWLLVAELVTLSGKPLRNWWRNACGYSLAAARSTTG